MTDPVRDGDQELPVVNDHPYVQAALAQRLDRDYSDRLRVGIERYGTGLQPFNQRDAGRDAYEEWLDLGAYLEQLREEHDALVAVLRRLVELKDGPRDEAYRASKDVAWLVARQLLQGLPS